MCLSQLASAWTGESLEQLLASFDATATELILLHRLRPSDLNARIRDALKAACAGMPKLPVLYCGSYASYGGYGLEEGSKFLSFLQSTSSLSPLRTGRTLRRPYAYEAHDDDEEEDKEGDAEAEDDGTEDGEVVACSQLQPGAIQHKGVFPQPPSSLAHLQAEEEAAPAHVPTLATLCIVARMRSSDSSPGSSSMATTYMPGGSSALDRVLDAQMLIPFGRALAAEWPCITQLLRAYHSPGGAECREHFRAVNQLVRCRKQLAGAVATHKRLAAALAPGAGWVFEGRDWTPGLWSSSAACIDRELDEQEGCAGIWGRVGEERLTRASVEEMRRVVDQEVTHLTTDVAAMAAALEAVPFADAMLDSASADKPGRERGDEGLSFSQAVAQHGEQHPGIWACQEYVDAEVMRHLACCPQHVSQLLQEQGQGAADEVLLELAMCAGSARCCQLRVELVPQLSEWAISLSPLRPEYDGLRESVLLV